SFSDISSATACANGIVTSGGEICSQSCRRSSTRAATARLRMSVASDSESRSTEALEAAWLQRSGSMTPRSRARAPPPPSRSFPPPGTDRSEMQQQSAHDRRLERKLRERQHSPQHCKRQRERSDESLAWRLRAPERERAEKAEQGHEAKAAGQSSLGERLQVVVVHFTEVHAAIPRMPQRRKLFLRRDLRIVVVP